MDWKILFQEFQKATQYLVRGEPGTGKTICCLQFLYRGAKNGEKCLYITTEETPETVMRTGGELWSDFPNLIRNGTIKVVNLSITASYMSEYCLVDKTEAMDIVAKGLAAQPGASNCDVALVPLLEEDEVVGILNVTVDATEREQVQQNLERRVKERTWKSSAAVRQLKDCVDILVVLNLGQPLDMILNQIVAQAVKFLGASSGVVDHIKTETGHLVIQAGYQVPEGLSVLEQIPLYPGGAVQQMFNQKPYVIHDIQEHLKQMAAKPAFFETPWPKWLDTIARYYQAYLGLPLIIEGEIYGALGLYYAETRHFSDEEIELGMDLANQTVLAIQNARLQQAEHDRQRAAAHAAGCRRDG